MSLRAIYESAPMTWAFQTAARTMCQEVRGEPPDGQTAVAWTIKNRLSDGRWGNSLASVCLWHAAFSGWWCPRGTSPVYHDPNFAYACGIADDDPMLIHMVSVMQAALDSGDDPTGGAMFYYKEGTKVPDWVVGDPARGVPAAIFCGKFGSQLFYRGVK